MADHRISLCNNDYEIIFSDGRDGKYNFEALRYGEKWRDLCGDNLMLCLVQKFLDLKEENKKMEAALFNFYKGTMYYDEKEATKNLKCFCRDHLMED